MVLAMGLMRGGNLKSALQRPSTRQRLRWEAG